MSRPSGDVRALKLSVGVYLIVFALKIVAYLITGVMALFAEAFHTLSDILISLFLLMAAVYSLKAADKDHMFGHGRAQNVAALVAATLFISFTSYKLYEEAIPKLFVQETAVYQNLPLALGVLVVSMVIAAIPFVVLMRQKEKGSAAKAQLRELVNDELGLVAALLGTIFIATGEPLGDPIATIVVATVIAYGAIGLFRENLTLLVGAAPGPEFMKRLEDAVMSVDGVLGIHSVTAEYVGLGDVHAGFHIEVRGDLFLAEADRISTEVHRRVQEATGCKFCVIHVDPAGACVQADTQT